MGCSSTERAECCQKSSDERKPISSLASLRHKNLCPTTSGRGSVTLGWIKISNSWRLPVHVRFRVVTYFDLPRRPGSQGALRDIRRVFLGAMLWGYGTVGYGPWRTRRMLFTPDSGNMLKKTFDLIAENRIEDAYSGFRLDWCGPSFFTKFFYFSGFGPGSRRYPLILDAVVRKSLMSLADVDHSDFALTSRWDPRGYTRYIQVMHEWAQELNCEAHNIELFLFSEART